MSSPVQFFALAMALLDSGTGIMLNGFIVIFNVQNMKKGFTMTMCDQVHFIMGLVNILIQCTMTTQGAIWVFKFQEFAKDVYSPLFFLNMFLNYSSYWMTSWLCVIYCISIANYNNQLFICLKRQLPTFLPHFLLLSIVGSLIICIPVFWAISLDPEEGEFGNVTVGLVKNSGTLKMNLMYVVTVNIFGCCLPFGLTLISLVLTISSLLLHIQNMKQKDMDLGQSKLQAHARAVKTMMIHLMLNLSTFIAEMLGFIANYVTVDAISLMSFFCMLSYPAAQSAIIFQSNSKLRSAFIKMFCLKTPCNRSTQHHSTERVKSELQANG